MTVLKIYKVVLSITTPSISVDGHQSFTRICCRRMRCINEEKQQFAAKLL